MNVSKIGWVASAVVLALGGFGGVAVAAEEEKPEMFDLFSYTCRDMLLSDREDEEDILLYMHGYLAGKGEVKVVDVDRLAAVTDAVKNTCIDSPDMSLLEVFVKHY